ncbi:VOC family protein [Thermus albus]|uniref:VOC family protein n=1 Tax=Thermus albus TaxID=2908146 RepID=UPI001FAA99A8|nr:VOC family protein [Thermus albus]
MRILAIDHVQIAMPPGGEERARAFYRGVLGLSEVPKPANLAHRGGVWFEEGPVRIHLGVEEEFRPARKAHVALVTDDLAAVVARCQQAGYPVFSDQPPLEGYRRVHILDPFGNRLEIMEIVAEPGS